MAGHLIATTRKEIPTEKSVKAYSNIRFCRSKEWLGLRTIKIRSIAKTARNHRNDEDPAGAVQVLNMSPRVLYVDRKHVRP
jgi:hypothetical protein